jgi:hypothetical protein
LIEECGGNKKPAEAGCGYFSFSCEVRYKKPMLLLLELEHRLIDLSEL